MRASQIKPKPTRNQAELLEASQPKPKASQPYGAVEVHSTGAAISEPRTKDPLGLPTPHREGKGEGPVGGQEEP